LFFRPAEYEPHDFSVKTYTFTKGIPLPVRGCRPPAADCLRASAQRTLEAQNTGVDFTRPAVKQVYEVMTPLADRQTVLRDPPSFRSGLFFFWGRKERSSFLFPKKKKRSKRKSNPDGFHPSGEELKNCFCAKQGAAPHEGGTLKGLFHKKVIFRISQGQRRGQRVLFKKISAARIAADSLFFLLVLFLLFS
jgi:hypothetical protein